MKFLGLFYIFVAPWMSDLPGAEAYWNGHLAQKQGDFVSALRYFEQVSSDSPLAPYAQVRRAFVLAQISNSEEGFSQFENVYRELPLGPAKRFAGALGADRLFRQKRYEQAARYFSEVIDTAFAYPWIRAIRRTAAECFVSVPSYQGEGYALLRGYLSTVKLQREKAMAAKLLMNSPQYTDKLVAADVLLDAGEYGEVRQLLIPMSILKSTLNSEEQIQLDYLRGRLMLGSGQIEDGRNLLLDIEKSSPSSVWARKSLAAVTRTFLGMPEVSEGLNLLDRLVKKYPDTDETGEVLFWYAERLTQGDDFEAAVQAYVRVATVCPSYSRSDQALFRAAELLRKNKRLHEAIRLYATLGEKYPQSSFLPEAWFRAGKLAQRLHHPVSARQAWQKAAEGPLGNFFVHRACAELERTSKKQSPDGKPVNVGGTHKWLLTKNVNKSQIFKENLQLPPVLQFFANHGLEEAEWEALHLLTSAENAEEQFHVLCLMSAVGLGASAIALVETVLPASESTPELGGARLRVQYPFAYKAIVEQVARETRLSPLLLLAIARQESLFQARVVSRAGATGVMQLMPTTAQWLAKVEPTITNEMATNLDVPLYSFTLGAHYLRRMLAKYDSNLVLALAAYNAGPGNVNKWLKTHSKENLDEFIDAIPFSETRMYVQKVLGNYAAYASLYDE